MCSRELLQRLTLSADHYEGDLTDRSVDGQLVVDFVNFLEAGFVLQAEDQDDSIHPTCKLRRREKKKKQSEV